MQPSSPSPDSDVKHLMFLSDLFSRAAQLTIGSKHLGRPLRMAASLREVLRGKLARAEITHADVQGVALLLGWLGTELVKVAG